MAGAVRTVLTRAVIVSALGYFVDIYDLLIFGILRKPSLESLGLTGAANADTGLFLLNVQMVGLLLGGILWGVLGDKRGRVSVLFGSILLYSLANIANAFVQDVQTYAVLRFFAGLGLAGELGAAITLVGETLSQQTRGYGTAIVAGVGILGAVAAALVAQVADWRTGYLIGGALGLVLLVGRLSLRDSGLYRRMEASGKSRGNFLLLFQSRRRFARYVWCILVGAPVWFVIGILVSTADKFAAPLGVVGAVNPAMAILWCYAGASLGDFSSGFLSQWFQTRRGVLFEFLALTSLLIYGYVFSYGLTVAQFYGLIAVLGFAAGYWAVFVTNASEQFGTDLRATVATTVPNLIRGSLVPITLAFQLVDRFVSTPTAAMLVGQACVLVALLAVRNLPETYGRDLDFLEAAAPVRVARPAGAPFAT